MELSKRDKDLWSGVGAFIATACILYLLLEVGWWTTLLVASLIGVAVGVMVDKLQGTMELYSKYRRDLIELALEIIVWGGIIFIILILILEAIGLLHSPSTDAVYTGWLLILSAGWMKTEKESGRKDAKLDFIDKRLDRIESRLDSLLNKKPSTTVP